MMKIPEVMPWLESKEAAAASATVEENWITEGPRSKEFTERLNALFGTKYGVFAPNGTLALYLGLAAMEIGPGDEVLVPDITFIGSATSVCMTGARPVFVEVNRRNFQFDVAKAESMITPNTKAVMPVHLYGMVADMEAIMAFAAKHNLQVIEDAAQAVGVHYKGQHSGTFGDVGCFSFFADKTITTGEGGYVICREESTYERLRLLRNQGRYDRGSFIHPAIGYNFRITDMQAAVGLIQLDKLDDIIQRKGRILEQYKSRLADNRNVSFLELQEGSEYVPFRVVLFCEGPHKLREHLAEKGAASRTFFYPLHKQPCFEKLATLGDDHYPNSVYGYDHGICLPVFPTMTEEQIDYICTQINSFFD